MVEYGPVMVKDRIRASTKNCLGEYREKVELRRVPKNYLGEYSKRVESV